MQASARSAGWTQQLLEAAAAVGGIHSMEGTGALSSRRPGPGPGGLATATGGQQESCAAEAAVVRQQELLLEAVGLRLLLATMEARH